MKKFKEALWELFHSGVSAGRLEAIKEGIEQQENEMELHFEITPYSVMNNVKSYTHTRIRKEASEKMSLTDDEKTNIDKAIFSAQSDYDKHKLDVIPYLRIAVFFGGWYCLPLREYIINKGYKISGCGNDFDLWVSLKETLSDQESLFVRNRNLQNIINFQNKLRK